MNRYIKVLFVFIFSFSFIACENDEEFFQLTNPPESPWQSLLDLEKAPIGAYYGLTGNGGFRAIFTMGAVAAEAFADGIALADPAEGFNVDSDVEDMYNRAHAGTQIGSFDNHMFNSGYFAIGFANGAIDFIESAEGNNPFPGENRPDEVDRIRGELYFVRAYAYYWVARAYLPVYPNDEQRIPFRINQATNFEEAIESPLASANDVYPQIVSDLQTAKSLLPERYLAGVHNASYEDGRANKFAAAALLAKVHFHMGNYADALTELNFVIDQNGGDYDLSEDPIEAWNKTGIDRGRETIWYYTLWAGDGLGGSSNWKHPGRFAVFNLTQRASFNPANNGDRFMVASRDFLEAAGWMNPDGSENPAALNDLRYTQLFQRYDAGNDPRTGFATTQPYVWNARYYRSSVDRSTNLPILRLADMYLLRATIHAMNSNFNDARLDLDIVRNRAGLADFPGTDGQLMDAIMLERRIELAFEGDRLYYLQGLEADIPSGDRTGGPIPYNSNFYSEVPDYEVEVNLSYQ